MAEPDEFYEAAFGTIRMWASRVSTVNSRTLVIHDPTSGDEHEVQDRGLETRITSCSLLFDDMDGETTTPRERFDAVLAMHLKGEAQIFRHPLLGSYRAMFGRFEHVLEDARVTVDVELVPVGEVPAIQVANAGTSAAVGEDAVKLAAELADDELLAVGLSSPVTEEARAAAESWQEPDAGVRRVLVDVGLVSEHINTEIVRLRLSRSLALWPAHRALLVLGETFAGAARSATADVARLMVVRTGRAIALNALLADVYGAREVARRRLQALDLNDIRTPGWIEQGTELRLPQPDVQRRAG